MSEHFNFLKLKIAIMKTLFTSIFLLSFFFSFRLLAQETFQEIIYKTDRSREYQSEHIAPTSDGGFIFAGTTGILNGGYYFVNLGKFTKTGELQWMRTISAGIIENPYPLQLEDGSFVIFGGNSFSLHLIKTDTLGNTIWAKEYSTGIWPADWGGNIIKADDGSLVVLSNNNIGVGITKIDPVNGNIIDDRHYSALTWSASMTGVAIYQTSDNGFIIGGITRSEYYSHPNVVCVLKVDEGLNTQWCRMIDANNGTAYLTSILQTLDGGYVFTGKRYVANTALADIVKLTSTGNLVWHKQFNSYPSNEFYDITKNQDSSFTVVGNSRNFPYDDYGDGIIMSINKNGDMLWTKFIGGQKNDIFNSIIKGRGTEKSYIAAGSTTSFAHGKGAFYISKFTLNGNTCANKNKNGFTIINIGDSIIDHSIIYTRNFTSQMYTADILISNTIVVPVVQSVCPPLEISATDAAEIAAIPTGNIFNASISPNPVTGKTIVLKILSPDTQKMFITIMNAEGKLLIQNNINLSTGINTKMLNVSTLGNGIYFLKLQSDKYQKLIQFINAD